MRALIWAAIGFGGTLAAVGAATFGVVQYVQNNDMREWAAWGAAKAGVPVTFAGPVQVKLWPQLVVKSQGLEVDSLQGSGPLVRVDALALQAAWGGGVRFWEGIQLQAIEAKNPTLTLQRDAQGVANWEAPKSAEAATTTEASTSANPLADLTAKGGMLASMRLAIQNLNLTYADATSGQRVVVKGMNIGARTEGTVATTSLKGTVNDQPLIGELVADVADLQNIPLKAKLEGAGAALALDGRVLESNGFAGLVNARSGNLKGTLQTLLGKAPAQAPASPAAITGDMVVKPEQLVLRNFSARVGELLQARGDVDMALGASPSGKGTVAVQGANLRALAELGSGTKQPLIPARPFNLQAKLAGENAIEVRDLTFNLEPVLQVRGQVTLTPKAGAQPDVATNLTLNAPSLQALLQAFGQTQKAPAQPLQATVQVQGQGGLYTLQNVQAVLTDLAKLNVKGTANVAGAAPQLELDAELQGANMAQTAAGFGVQGNLPSSGFSVRAKVRGSGPYELEGLTVNLPGLAQVLANLTYSAGTPANLAGDVNIAQLNATKLGFCGAAAGGGAGGGGGGAAAASQSAAPWSDEVIDLSVLRQVGLNLTVKASGIDCASFPLDRVNLTVRNTPSQLDLEKLVVDLANGGGQLAGTVNLAHAGTPKLNTQLQLKEVKVEQLITALREKGVRLPLNGVMQLATQGATTRLMAQNLGGNVVLKATEGQLPYTNMLGNVVALERMLQGQAALPANGSGAVDAFDLALVLRQGVGTFETLKVATGNGAMNLNGTGLIDLPNWAIDLTLTPQLATSQGLAVPILVRGPLTAPAIGADPNFTSRLTKRLATEGVKALLGLDKENAKGLGGVVGDVLGGKGVTQEGVGNLLNQFMKPKPAAQPAAPSVTQPAATPPAEAPAAQAPAPAAPPAAEPTPTPEPVPVSPEDALKGLMEGVLKP